MVRISEFDERQNENCEFCREILGSERKYTIEITHRELLSQTPNDLANQFRRQFPRYCNRFFDYFMQKKNELTRFKKLWHDENCVGVPRSQEHWVPWLDTTDFYLIPTPEPIIQEHEFGRTSIYDSPYEINYELTKGRLHGDCWIGIMKEVGPCNEKIKPFSTLAGPFDERGYTSCVPERRKVFKG